MTCNYRHIPLFRSTKMIPPGNGPVHEVPGMGGPRVGILPEPSFFTYGRAPFPVSMAAHGPRLIYRRAKGYTCGMKIGSVTRPQVFDLVLIAALLFVAGFWWMLGAFESHSPSWVQIHTDQGIYREVPLSEDGEIRVPGPLGESLVMIRGGRVSMAWSPCQNKLCMHMGEAGGQGESIVCIPNRVSIVIRVQAADMDAVSF